jgi:DNA-directed RNA polymerase specialized sigma24 family protein
VVGELRPDDIPSFDDLWQQEWALQDVYWCLDQIARDISPRRMQAFRLYVLEGISAQDTAAAVSMTVNHVYLVRHQVLHMIRKRLHGLDHMLPPSTAALETNENGEAN